MLGTIIDRVEPGYKYIIQWCDETKSSQEEEHLFGAFRRRIEPQVDYFVLAIDDDQYIYKPAKVTVISRDRKTLTIRFLDSKKNNR
jgi:hypothetical protein